MKGQSSKIYKNLDFIHPLDPNKPTNVNVFHRYFYNFMKRFIYKGPSVYHFVEAKEWKRV